jgi:hypothetical protein
MLVPMPEVFVATPFRNVSRPKVFGEGISTRKLDRILWDIAIVKQFVAEHEREQLAKTRNWLLAAREYEHAFGSAGEELYDRATSAAMSLHIICPTSPATASSNSNRHQPDGITPGATIPSNSVTPSSGGSPAWKHRV